MDSAVDSFREAFGEVKRRTLDDGVAEDFIVDSKASVSEIAQFISSVFGDAQIDIIVQDVKNRRKNLLIADMDSTIIAQECIDELADYAGLKSEISAITEQAMRGEIDFEEALTKRVGMLKGLPESILEECFRSRISLNPGAITLVATMKARGAQTVLVSGGFTFFVSRVAQIAGFQSYRANELMIEDGALTGELRRPILGRKAKELALHQFAENFSVPLGQTLAVGDGANDLDMINASGLGVAYRAKPKVAAAAHASIRYSDLTALLYAQGIASCDFVVIDDILRADRKIGQS
ncbi:MAG: phosphoserine phosphatase SerB [Parvularculaceae bacterium]|nr:phosphoserine phosphatase SerB [Parvularculaceae bacterium]